MTLHAGHGVEHASHDSGHLGMRRLETDHPIVKPLAQRMVVAGILKLRYRGLDCVTLRSIAVCELVRQFDQPSGDFIVQGIRSPASTVSNTRCGR